jgi:cell division protein FtsW (lipid II flippase)
MKKQTFKEWIWPPADQWVGIWGVLLIAGVAIVTTWILNFFKQLSGMPWIWCYVIGIGVAALGAALIFYAKLPLYRQRRFLTFGPRALPEQRRPFYRWGYTCARLGALLLACLLLSKH